VIDLDTAFGEQLLHGSVQQPLLQVPAPCNRDRSRREADLGKNRNLLNLSERLPSANAAVPVNHVCHLAVEHILGSPPWYR
jgi:hypothetical protein